MAVLLRTHEIQIIIVNLYMPISRLRIHSKSHWGDLERYLMQLMMDYPRAAIMIGGDCNARINALEDSDIGDMPHLTPEDSPLASTRILLDQVSNFTGRLLIQLANKLDLHILNGAVNGDCPGQFTFFLSTKRSIIDYVMVSRGLIDKIIELKVTPRPESDHFPLRVTCRLTNEGVIEPSLNRRDDPETKPSVLAQRIKWSPELEARLTSWCYSEVGMEEHKKITLVCIKRCEEPAPEGALVSQTEAIVNYEALISLLIPFLVRGTQARVRATSHISYNKPWFDQDCKKAKKVLLQLSADRKINNTLSLDTKFKQYKGSYKSLIKAKKEALKERQWSELIMALNKKDEASFWRLVSGVNSFPRQIPVPEERWFQDDILEICLKILDTSTNFQRDPGMDCSCRNDPVYISRVLNNMICCHKKKSILKVPPSNNYLHGLSPFMWNGSVPILRQWYHTKCKPVKYGHCGTFASVMCTVMRCLGIPSRVVTGFYCPLNAVDTLIVQEVFDYTGKTLSGKENIWSHHCWNESWMVRKDINQSGGDWQYLDPSLVETSKGSVCSGPICVNSIRDGDVDTDPDGSHVFCLLNARSTAWVSQGKGKKTKLHCDSWPCGQCISTKSVGSDLREDVTYAYKHELGSAQEKKALYKACRKISSQYLNAPNSEIDKDITSHRNRGLNDTGMAMKFKVANCPLYGEDVQINWVLENLSNETKEKKFNLCAQGMMYNGCSLDHLWKDNMHITLDPKEVKTILIKIPYDNYGSQLCDHNIMRVVAVSMPECKGDVMMVERDILIDSLPIGIKILDQPRLNALCSAEVTFSNPLNEDLKNCVLNLEGYGLIGEPTATELGTLAAHHMAQTCVEFTPYRLGRHQFIASISCNKFCNCKGYTSVDMGKPPTTSGEGGA
ncbi:protein-glutamine gamma-glutamyltransferase 5-like [Hemicordylus capensis]|uniref:protein-glutamine gamma-glutamyltransferase 5-like n=1 Tax=Hemicordylus capensis TaxID=884348 RepID=UPI0023041DBD|nr:protein-glutamine gamma-glutamyltransferase 5-like [Hemicordylus capensis]